MTNALSHVNEDILAEGNFTPYDILFANYFAPDECDSGYPNIQLWCPISDETASILRQVVEGISNETTREVIDLLYGLRDGNYYSINDAAKMLGLTASQVMACIGLLSNKFYRIRENVYATISEEARKEIERGYALRDTNLCGS